MSEFMLPRYRKLYQFLQGAGRRGRGHGLRRLQRPDPRGDVPRDGLGKVIDGIQPIEIAADNDPEAILRENPGIYIQGGIDKRELRFDKARARAEVVKRYRVAREYGGYIPTVDHGVPPDIPLRTFLYMVELLKGFADGEDLDTYEPPVRAGEATRPDRGDVRPAQGHRAAYAMDDGPGGVGAVAVGPRAFQPARPLPLERGSPEPQPLPFQEACYHLDLRPRTRRIPPTHRRQRRRPRRRHRATAPTCASAPPSATTSTLTRPPTTPN